MTRPVAAVDPDWPPPSLPRASADVLPSDLAARSELTVAVMTALYVALLGPAVGLVWAAVAPKVSLKALAANSSAAFHPLIGADAWFLLVGGVAGALTTVLAMLVVRREGPGLAVGLATGGAIAAIVADRVGFLAEHSASTEILRALGASSDGSNVAQIDFRIRALGVLTVWPLAALVVLGVVVAVNAARR